MSWIHSYFHSFGYAFEGLRKAFKTQPNFRVHVFLSIIVLLLAALFRFSSTEWLIIIFTIAFVLAAELINTSLEAIVNLHSPEFKEDAKIAKDVAAAAVVIAAICAFLVGIILFTPKAIELLYY